MDKKIYYTALASSIFEEYISWKNINQVYTHVKENKKAGIVSIKLILNRIAKRMFDMVKNLNPEQLNELKVNFNQKDWEIISLIVCEQKAIIEQQTSNINL